jgi:hypothetical protein
MKKSKKSLIILFCATMIIGMSSCSRKNATGCPGWTKAKAEQTHKKSV